MKTAIQFFQRQSTANIAALLCLVLSGGCSFAPNYARPVVQTPVAFKELAPDQFQEKEGWKTAEPKDHEVRGNWWEIFREAELNALEGQVTVSNQNIAAAFANFLAARAVVKQSRSQYFPTVSASPSVTRSRQPSTVAQSGSSQTPSTITEYSLPFDASWELDFWGRIRNSVKASSFEAQATFADLENVRLTVQAEVAADFFQVRGLDAQKQLLDAAVLGFQRSLKLTQIQRDAGMASDQDVAQAETQLNITLAQDSDIGIQRAQLEHAIATLIGKPASLFSMATNSLTAKPVPIPFTVPSQLLERRPDIAAAERRVAEANAQIGVARAAYFPTITLSGSVGYQGSSLGNLASGPGLAWSVGSTLAQTLFDAGKRKAVTEQARARYQGTVANYRQAVLSAFQEVEDYLSALRIVSQELQQQNGAVESSQRYLTLANHRYSSGIEIYLEVIAAQTALLSNQRTAMSLRVQRMTASVQLIKALGGSWERSTRATAAVP